MAKKWFNGRQNSSYLPFEVRGCLPSLSDNIGRSGMQCRTAKWIDEMTLLDIKIQLPEPNGRNPRIWVQCRGVVVSCERKDAVTADLPYEVEIFFDNISESDRNLLTDYIKDTK